MTKYYRVLKDNSLWKENAILEYREDYGNNGGYVPIQDIWNRTEDQTEYISQRIVEDKANADFYERVYPSKTDEMIFVTADELKKLYRQFVPDRRNKKKAS